MSNPGTYECRRCGDPLNEAPTDNLTRYCEGFCRTVYADFRDSAARSLDGADQVDDRVIDRLVRGMLAGQLLGSWAEAYTALARELAAEDARAFQRSVSGNRRVGAPE